MKTQVVGFNGKWKLPQTQIYSLFDDQLIIFLRSWSGFDAHQKVIDEVSHFLSAANADIEVTTPFEFSENLSTLANKVRISILLANDIIYKTENKQKYLQGYELAVVFKNQQELSWSTVGRFEVKFKKNNKNITASHGGQFLDDQVLLPASLIGINREPSVQSGSVSLANLSELYLQSSFDENATYWKATITDFF